MELETSTSGWEINTRRPWLASTVELLSSMRFAISLLCMIAIASVVGTVLKQNEPVNNYINQFGPFWFEVFQSLGLYSLYSAWWFLLIMTFLVVSTSLCIWRNAPKMLKDMASWRDSVREQSLRNFHHKAEWQTAEAIEISKDKVIQHLKQAGYQYKVVEKEQAILVAAKRGAGNKWGYIFAHAAIVIICIGATFDSDLAIRFQTWFMGKVPYNGGNTLIDKVPEQHRLAKGTPTFRGNVAVPEGSSANVAIIQQSKGVLLQDLPFTIQLKKFNIDFYSTGMPKLFASDVTIIDHETGKSFDATVKVNHPLIYKGIAIFQSSFDDGGSRLQLRAHPMRGASSKVTELNGTMGGSNVLDPSLANGEQYTIEWSGFRPLNIEDLSRNAQDVRSVNQSANFVDRLSADLDKHSGAAVKRDGERNLKNVGPTVQYKLRDKTGQAREFHNYMAPILLDGAWVFLAGTRDSPNEAFRYLRIPADEESSLKEWMRLRAAIADPELRVKAAERYANRALPNGDARQFQAQLAASASKGLADFAGADANAKLAGYAAVSEFISKRPEAEREKTAEVYLKILNGSMWDLWQLARERDGLGALEMTEQRAQFLQMSMSSLSDAFFYGAPVYLELSGFEEVKASVFQVTRAPGQNIVYLGCLFLTLGVFAMFYIRERRVWCWFKTEANATHMLMAMSSQRKTLDFEKEFEQLKKQLSNSFESEIVGEVSTAHSDKI
ncbi:cytochrome c biogenesis protein ResB [Undibacterium cyanobacteriorum]|uniref:Cytochrome c biogenesis protein ResB n=1 Tax=Undibacterium cyanobacteriorum TaxID=3073561 RepID=A0ABY9RML6_9BURK|nr:cytochrome c biogenesis protein ResB [Undibacterium sp. 20NA77.5]WMW81236.1 cytochrome c biogenesis protein ResB [Undibacterium sp. 20NA77.5]